MKNRFISLVILALIVCVNALACLERGKINSDTEVVGNVAVAVYDDSVEGIDDTVFHYSIAVPDSISIFLKVQRGWCGQAWIYPHKNYLDIRMFKPKSTETAVYLREVIENPLWMEWASKLFFARTEPVVIKKYKGKGILMSESYRPNFSVEVYNGRKTTTDIINLYGEYYSYEFSPTFKALIDEITDICHARYVEFRSQLLFDTTEISGTKFIRLKTIPERIDRFTWPEPD